MGSSTAYWYIYNHIIFVHNVGDLTADDFRQVDKQIISFMEEAFANGVSETHVIVDCTDLKSLPSVTHLEGGRILKYLAKDNCGWTLIVGYRTNPFLVILSRLLTSMMKKQLLMSDTLASTLITIAQLSPELELVDIEAWKKENITTPESR